TCWIWIGSHFENGYGQFTVTIKGRHTNRKAHRVSYEIFKVPIPKGLWVLHKCDNRLCVRPSHLFLGNNSVNQKDSYLKGRSRSASQNGENNSRHKLTKSQVKEIRRRY